ncbi:MAG: rhomboid family intramembrane serine protease [Chlamydiales bacterium]|nr:rhomboid family intramembrane serine protease [Chlamydiales bacterium]
MKTSFKQQSPPTSLRIFLVTLVLLSLFCALFNKLIMELFPEWSIDALLGLSSLGLDKKFYWQFLTYFFVEPGPEGFTFTFILNLVFDSYLLWVLSTSIIKKTGEKTFSTLFLFSGITSGLFGALLMYFTNSTTLLIGPTPTLYALLFVWLMLFPHFEIVQVTPFPIKARMLIFIFLALSFLGKLSEGAFLLFSVHLGSLVIGYLFATLVFGARSPFAWTRKLDYVLTSIGKWIRKKLRKKSAADKIIDINWR